MEAKHDGSAKLVVLDPRMSNTACHADLWLAPWPGQRGGDPAGGGVAPAAYRADRRATTCAGGSTGRPTSSACTPTAARLRRRSSTALDRRLRAATRSSSRPRRRGCRSSRSASSPRSSPPPGTALSAHIWRSAAAGNLGGWQVARCLFFLNVLTGSVGTPGGTSPNGWDKFIAARLRRARRATTCWNELLLPAGVPAVVPTRCRILLPHFLNEGPGQARRLLLARLQPGLDQPRRLLAGSRR